MLTWDEYVTEIVSILLPFLCTGGLGVGLLVVVLWIGPEDK